MLCIGRPHGFSRDAAPIRVRVARGAAPCRAAEAPGRRRLGLVTILLTVALAGACQRIDTLEGEVAALRQAGQEQASQLAQAQARLAEVGDELEALRRAEWQRAEQEAEAEARLAEVRQELEDLRQAGRTGAEQLALLEARQAEVQAHRGGFYEVVPAEAAVEVEPEVPEFPWPPPRASASVVVPASFIRSSGIADPTLGAVAELLGAALDTGGYFDRSYFAAPGGFAMVTRLERIDADGTPSQPGRWSVEAQPLESFSLGAYLRALFTAPAGYYRIIVFVVSSQAFTQSAQGVSREEALDWLHEGLNRLPDSIAGVPYTGRHAVTALIYQFEQPGRQEALLVLQGGPSGREHLQRAQLWDAFAP